MTQTSFRDVEQLSALLDEKLNPADAARLESRLASDPDLRAVYDDLRQTRALLRQLPQRRAPRNFTLKPSAARVRPPLPRLFPTFRLASALASLLLFFSLATNAALPRLVSMANQSPLYAYGMGGGPDAARAQGGGGGEEDSSLPIGGGVDLPSAPEAEEQAAMEAPVEEPAPAMEEPAGEVTEPQPEPTMQIAALPPAEEAQPFEEKMPETLPEPEPMTPPIPGWLVWLLAILAAASGGIAFFARWRADRRWKTGSKK
jgi:hypothetical protein